MNAVIGRGSNYGGPGGSSIPGYFNFYCAGGSETDRCPGDIMNFPHCPGLAAVGGGDGYGLGDSEVSIAGIGSGRSGNAGYPYSGMSGGGAGYYPVLGTVIRGGG